MATHLIIITGTLLPVVATSDCSEIWVREDPSVTGWPTTDLLIAEPGPASPAVQYVRGEWIPFKSPTAANGQFAKGDVVGHVATQSGGTTTGAQREI